MLFNDTNDDASLDASRLVFILLTHLVLRVGRSRYYYVIVLDFLFLSLIEIETYYLVEETFTHSMLLAYLLIQILFRSFFWILDTTEIPCAVMEPFWEMHNGCG